MLWPEPAWPKADGPAPFPERVRAGETQDRRPFRVASGPPHSSPGPSEPFHFPLMNGITVSRIKHVIIGLAAVAALVAVPAGARAATERPGQAVADVVTPDGHPVCGLCW